MYDFERKKIGQPEYASVFNWKDKNMQQEQCIAFFQV